MTTKNQLCLIAFAVLLASWGDGTITTPTNKDSARIPTAEQALKKVTPETFIRAETDRMFYDVSHLPGHAINACV